MRRRMIRKFVRGCSAGNGPPATPEAPAAWEAGRGASRSLLFFPTPQQHVRGGSRELDIFYVRIIHVAQPSPGSAEAE